MAITLAGDKVADTTDHVTGRKLSDIGSTIGGFFGSVGNLAARGAGTAKNATEDALKSAKNKTQEGLGTAQNAVDSTLSPSNPGRRLQGANAPRVALDYSGMCRMLCVCMCPRLITLSYPGVDLSYCSWCQLKMASGSSHSLVCRIRTCLSNERKL